MASLAGSSASFSDVSAAAAAVGSKAAETHALWSFKHVDAVTAKEKLRAASEASSKEQSMRDSWFADAEHPVSVGDATVVRRDKKCAQILANLVRNGVHMLRAPTCAGTTSFGRLLQAHAQARGELVHLMDVAHHDSQLLRRASTAKRGDGDKADGTEAGADVGGDGASVHARRLQSSQDALDAFWEAETGMALHESLDPLVGPPRTYIIDGAQRLFGLGSGARFWLCLRSILGSHERDGRRARVLLLASHGSREMAAMEPWTATAIGPSGCDWWSFLHAPIDLPEGDVDSWTFHGLLQLDDEELAEFFHRFNSTCEEHGYCPIPAEAQAAMLRVCGRHVGLLREALKAYCDMFKRFAPGDFKPAVYARFAAALECRLPLHCSAFPRTLPAAEPASEAAAWARSVAAAGDKGVSLTAYDRLPAALVCCGLFDVSAGTRPAARCTAPLVAQMVMKQWPEPTKAQAPGSA